MKFSITIPAYKAKFLYEAIDSVLKQTYDDFELIIVDDCSPEDLKSIVDKFSDSRIHYYRNKKNCGAVDVVDNWNICLSYCSGDYVICMGDDDRLLPCCLEEYVKLMEKFPGLEVYHAWTEIIDENDTIVSLQEPRPEYEGGLSLIINRWKGRNQYIGDFCYDTKALRKEGGYYKLPLAWSSDDITALRAAMKGGIANMQTLGFQYRKNSLTISNGGHADIKLKAAFLEREYYRKLYSKISKDDISIIEKKYYSIMEREIENYFHLQRKACLIDCIDGNLIKLVSYVLKRSELESSIARLVSYWFEGLKK